VNCELGTLNSQARNIPGESNEPRDGFCSRIRIKKEEVCDKLTKKL
jgi:hypothetical protein